MNKNIPAFLTVRPLPAPGLKPSSRVKIAFVSRGMRHAAAVLRDGFIQWETASRKGFFQGLDARVKVVFLAVFAVLISIKGSITPQAAISVFLLLAAIASRIGLVVHYRRIFVLTFLFGFVLGLPSALNLITSGNIVAELIKNDYGQRLWSYDLPSVIGFTDEGLRRLAILCLRVFNSLSVSFLVLSTTPFHDLIKGLKVLRAPDIFLMTITLAYKYIFIFSTIVHDMHLAKKSRLAGAERRTGARQWIAGRIAFLFHRSRRRCDEVFRAMLARGLRDSVRYPAMPPVPARDLGVGLGLFISAIIFYCI